jgi:excisionase family DNA binding protein
MTAKILLTLMEVGDQLNVSAKTVRRLIAAGHLRGTFVGRQVRVRPQDLAEFLATAETPQSLGERR